MPCPLCGDICRCCSGAYSAASPRWLPDSDTGPDAATPHVGRETSGAEAPSLDPSAEASRPNDSKDSAPEDSTPWRQELAARLNRYQARRKPRPPRYPSLRLRFDHEDSTRAAPGIPVESQAFPQRMANASHQALALDGFADSAAHSVEIPASRPLASPEAQAREETAAFPSAAESPRATAPTTAKIIEFPRSWTPPPAPLDELAEPVFDRDRPRILEAPEVVPPPPALGGITIDPAQQPEMEKRPGIDIPLQSAPLARRIFSAAIDDVIIAAACTLFSFIFWKVTAIRPPRFQILGLTAGFSGLFWASYQYLLVVHSGTTPGLRLARLELARFDGSRASRRLRRWRVLASFLSAVSLGMGYVWVFLDEDSLCWHDRITHTYLAPKR
ncbi:MAG: RDD family protein [Candidatus Sulfotelmatobacter sp.]